MIASRNIRIGPRTQFWTKDRSKNFLFLNTSPILHTLPLQRGYIMRIRPMAIGIFWSVPT